MPPPATVVEAPPEPEVVLRAYRFALDPTDAQLALLAGHAGAARFAFNHALATKISSHEQWREQVTKLVESGVPEPEARKQVKVPIPNQMAIKKAFNAAKGDSRTGEPGLAPWWWEYSTYAFQSAFIDADRAWKNWLDSYRGQRAGRRVGYPRLKKKNRCRDSFRVHHDVTRPTIRLDGYRRLVIPRLGSIRTHDSGKRLSRAIQRGGVVQSVSVARDGHRWHASVLVKSPAPPPVKPCRRQREAGRVGVAIGVRHLAALSDGTLVDNPRHLDRDQRRLVKAQRRLSRTHAGSNRRRRAARRVGRIHGQVAARRAGTLHQLTKRLATGYAEVALPTLDIPDLTRSHQQRRRRGKPSGRPPKVDAALNRAILDVAPGEIRRQLDYKTGWYGSSLLFTERGYPTASTCSACGAVKTKLAPSVRVFQCECGLRLPREVNSARVIAQAATLPPPPEPAVSRTVVPDGGETLNARGGPVRPVTFRGGGRGPSKREGPRGHPG